MSPLDIAQIHPTAFCHPDDRAATAALRKVPLLPEVFRWVSRLGIEEKVRYHYMNYAIRLGPRQLPSLWRLVHEVAESLGMTASGGDTAGGVGVYVSGEKSPNAFAFGAERTTVVLTSSLVDLLTDEELKAIVTHEFAHVLCQHMLYRRVGLALAEGAGGLISGAAAARPVRLLSSWLIDDALMRLFYAWWRAAEYSADRAALLILDDPEPLASSLSRLAGLPRRFASEFDLLRFAEQIDQYEEKSSVWSKIVTHNLRAFRTHPEPARRAVAVLEWARSEEFQRIRRGEYLTQLEGEAEEQVEIEGVRSCPLCRRPVGLREVCPECGLVQEASLQDRCPRGHLVSPGWRFCKSCGLALSLEPKDSESPAD